MKYISFSKFKNYIEDQGFILEKNTNIYYDLKFISYFFSNKNKNYKYMVNVFLDKNNNPTDHIISINKGCGSIFIGWEKCKVDFRKKMWNSLV